MRTLNTTIIIDDDPMTAIIFEKINGVLHFTREILGFYSAVDGLDYLLNLKDNRQDAPDAIFLDITMPIVSGWQFLEQYEALSFPETTVYMLTASDDQSDINRAKKFANVKDYLVKPLTLGLVKTVLEDLTPPSAQLLKDTVVGKVG